MGPQKTFISRDFTISKAKPDQNTTSTFENFDSAKEKSEIRPQTVILDDFDAKAKSEPKANLQHDDPDGSIESDGDSDASIDPIAHVPRPARPDSPRPGYVRPVTPENNLDDDLPSIPYSPDPLDVINQSFNAQVNHVIAFAASVLPQTYAQARASPHWPEIEPAMRAEIEKLERYRVWEVVNLQKGMRVLDARWVYTQKPNGWKARWVAKGFRQLEGLEYNELHAAVAHKDTIRVFLSLVNYFDFECDQVDIVSAFLNGELEETIYVHPPELSDIPKGKVVLLKKSLYGLKQSPRCFNKKFDSWLKSIGFTVAKADPCLYIRRKGESHPPLHTCR